MDNWISPQFMRPCSIFVFPIPVIIFFMTYIQRNPISPSHIILIFCKTQFYCFRMLTNYLFPSFVPKINLAFLFCAEKPLNHMIPYPEHSRLHSSNRKTFSRYQIYLHIKIISITICTLLNRWNIP